MKVTIFGSGYVGLVTGACLADVGNDVVCVDVDNDKIAMLNRGEVPIYEPGLTDLIRKNAAEGRLRFTSDAEFAVQHGLYQFIAVGTPPNEDGSADLTYVLQVAQTIGRYAVGEVVVVSKSTVPVGTADQVTAALEAARAARIASTATSGDFKDQSPVVRDTLSAWLPKPFSFSVVSNPEFLKEGDAIADFNKPDRIVVGSDTALGVQRMQALYAPFNRNHDRIVVMDLKSAELTKYAANAMLATKISFMNELATIAERVGADIEKVRVGIGSDPRIGYHFIYPGAGYGGSCFPKDVKALCSTATTSGAQAEILAAVERVNARQKQSLFAKLTERLPDLSGLRIAVWGLAFKPNTDDMREAPSRVLIDSVLAAGGTVVAYDPIAARETQKIYGERPDLIFADSAAAALQDASALVICTEWREFQSPDFGRMRAVMRNPLIIDGRNIYQPATVASAGLTYVSVGRAAVSPQPL